MGALCVLDSEIRHKHDWLMRRLRESAPLVRPLLPECLGDSALIQVDLSESNMDLKKTGVKTLEAVSAYIQTKLVEENAMAAFGGHGEVRRWHMPGRNTPEASLTHLGFDFWSADSLSVCAPFGGSVYALSFDDRHCGMGARMILEHRLGAVRFYTVYGRLSAKSLKGKQARQAIEAGERLGEFGSSIENGGWMPHLHFQIIVAGEEDPALVGSFGTSEQRDYLMQLCPDPACLLHGLDCPGRRLKPFPNPRQEPARI